MIPKFLRRAALRADENPTEETCGIIVKRIGKENLFVPCENVADDKANQFAVSSQAYRDAVKIGKVVASFHSHVNASCRPSKEDVKMSEATNIPMFIYSLKTRKWCCYRPQKIRKRPLLGRSYIWGVQDCLALVSDWYERANVKLDVPFHISIDLELKDVPKVMLKEALKAASGRCPKDQKPQIGDMILIQPKNAVEPHYGVVCSEFMFIHQCNGHLSRRDRLDSPWLDDTHHLLRPGPTQLANMSPPEIP